MQFQKIHQEFFSYKTYKNIITHILQLILSTDLAQFGEMRISPAFPKGRDKYIRKYMRLCACVLTPCLGYASINGKVAWYINRLTSFLPHFIISIILTNFHCPHFYSFLTLLTDSAKHSRHVPELIVQHNRCGQLS